MRIVVMILMMFPSILWAQGTLKAPNRSAEPINQRRAYGNGCGPASLLNAFQYGSPKWQKIFESIPGHNSRTRITYVVRAWGQKPSKHIKGTQRWNPKQGVNLLDLTDMANEMRSGKFLPKIKYAVLSQKSKESKTAMLQRVHKKLASSLTRGLPPIVSIRRYAYRYNQQVGGKSWWPIRAHFVVIIEMPSSLPPNATSFNIRYIDPYGGFVRDGKIQTNTGRFNHCPYLGTSMPHTAVGKSFVKPAESTLLTLAAVIGNW